jgi:hypothetical protein
VTDTEPPPPYVLERPECECGAYTDGGRYCYTCERAAAADRYEDCVDEEAGDVECPF